MNFHIPTAMLLTAITTLIMGLSLAFTVTDYPRALQVPIRQWVRSLLVSPIAPLQLFTDEHGAVRVLDFDTDSPRTARLMRRPWATRRMASASWSPTWASGGSVNMA